MNALTFRLALVEPLLIADVAGGDPNSTIGLDFIPGSAIRGALIDRFVREQPRDADDPELRRLFFGGALRFLNAYPWRNGQRLLPMPRSWHRDRDQTTLEDAIDLAVAEASEAGEVRLTPVPEAFCRIAVIDDGHDPDDADPSARGIYCQPARQVNVHTYHADRNRAAKHENTVYRYEAIAAGEEFGAVVLADDARDLDVVRSLLEDPEFSLGRAQTAGYGRVRVDRVETHDDWQEYQSVGGETDNLVVTTLSDVLIRNADGAYATSLEEIVGSRPIAAFVATRMVGGFNRTWGLPLPQALAIRAGSVYVFPDSDEIHERLRVFERTGIGERRVEGFGRIAVNWHRVRTLKLSKYENGESLPPPLDQSSRDLARRMATRMWRRELDRALVATVHRLEIQRQPTNAQLARMRRVAREAGRRGDPSLITTFLNHLKPSARQQLDRARIQEKTLEAWLRDLVAEPTRVFAELQVNTRHRPRIGDQGPDEDDCLVVEYVARLIDGVCAKAAKGGPS